MREKKVIKLGIIGLGCRADSLIKKVFMPMLEEDSPDIEIAAVCDLYEDRIEKVCVRINEKTGKRPFGTTDWKEITDSPEVDAVIILSAWESHTDIAVRAMRRGKYTGLDVGGAYSVEDCWALVRAYEESGTPFMFLENCCYGRREMMIYNMVAEGLLGEVVACEGGYSHDLRNEVAFGKENRHYRLRNYLMRNCENYPTHELGPIAKLLKINDGNRMMTLTSTASAAKGLHKYIEKNNSDDKALAGAQIRQGDIITTVITCAGGETITLQLNTTLPTFYNRRFSVYATGGCYFEMNDSVFLDRKEDSELEFDWNREWGNAEKYAEKYDHPLWKSFLSDIRGDHGGMDWLVIKAFIETVKNGTEAPIDVYDAASWMAVTALSEESIILGGRPVAIPDFTRSKWMNRKRGKPNRFSLFTVCDEQETPLY